MAESLINIEVVFATPARQLLLQVAVPSGTSIREAVRLSGIAEQFPEWDMEACEVGVFGKVIADAQARLVEQGDRIELYRPLLADPKEVRRLRAAKAAQARGDKS